MKRTYLVAGWECSQIVDLQCPFSFTVQLDANLHGAALYDAAKQVAEDKFGSSWTFYIFNIQDLG